MSESDRADGPALAVLAALVDGRRPDHAFAATLGWEHVLRAGCFHGVLPWIHTHWDPAQLADATAPAFAAGCAVEARRAVAADLAQRQAIARVLPLLAEAGAAPLLFKGSALAVTVYPQPALRPRADVDLLIAPGACAAAQQALAAAGLVAEPRLPGEYVSGQASWTLNTAGGGAQCFDVHWRISNSAVLARLIDHPEVAARAQPLPALSPLARAVSATDALLVAALHRVRSRDTPYQQGGWSVRGGDRLIWLLDFVLIARALDAEGRAATLRLFHEKGALPLLDDAIAAVRALLPALGSALDGLAVCDTVAASPRAAALARYVRARPWQRRWADLRALGGWRERLRYLAEQLFPPADYLRQRDRAYAHWPRLLLIARRLLRRARP